LTNDNPAKSSVKEWWEAMIYKQNKKKKKNGYLYQPRLAFGPMFT